MSTELKTLDLDHNIVASVALNGDLSKLSPPQKVQYLSALCNRLGLDPVTQPLKLMKLNGKEIVYADRGCAAQLNRKHGVSSEITKAEQIGDIFMVYSRATTPDGRFTDEIGAVPTTGLKGEALANAYMKCRTKGMRRATLTHVGLGLLDETEVEAIPNAVKVPITPEPAPQRPGDAPILSDRSSVIDGDGNEKFVWTDDDQANVYAYLDQIDKLKDQGFLDEDKLAEIVAKVDGEKRDGLHPDKVLNRLANYIQRVTAKKVSA